MKGGDMLAFILLLGIFAAVVLWLTRGARAIATAQRQGTQNALSIPIYVPNLPSSLPDSLQSFNWNGFQPGDFLVTQDIGS